MERTVNLLIGFLIGVSFLVMPQFIPLNSPLFEGFAFIFSILALIGFFSVIVLGLSLLLEAFKNIKK
ncbi:hypothetical protein [Alteribacillus sp. YIM 98480]|uniref:hypothetical protein n=1 Tax=Alteribacillus sp. YIM 98480 TaxID=2606599 RepID=UPI00131AAC7E|nr:hypothetical protein [Alteribacillus sp. YIM 98480]